MAAEVASRLIQPHPSDHGVTISSDTSVKGMSNSRAENGAYEVPAAKALPERQRSLASIGLFILSICSTTLSGLFLVVAIVQPRYGYIISNPGPFSPSSAALLTAFLAKTIELTFVVSYLSFLGQVLSKRALERRGIRLADIAMRSWILQPGSIIAQWYTVKSVGLGILGLLTLATVPLSLLYTTAAGTLVQPQLRSAPIEGRILSGDVQSDFYSAQDFEACETPLRTDPDENEVVICVALQYASSCQSNFKNYLKVWNEHAIHVNASGHDEGPRKLQTRPLVASNLDNNITVHTTWLGSIDAKLDLEDSQRTVNNVTIAVPHRGIPKAIRDPRNKIIQPADLHGAGAYVVTAQVAAPVFNAMCVDASRDELAPIVYEAWTPGTDARMDDIDWDRWSPPDWLDQTPSNNRTVLDRLFGWTDGPITSDGSDVESIRYINEIRPFFPKYPIRGNTILNHYGPPGQNSVYLLGKDLNSTSDTYLICALKAGLTTECSTRYNVSTGGQTLEALCGPDYRWKSWDGPDKGHPYSGSFIPTPNWPDIAHQFIDAMSLNDGMSDKNVSLARTLMQLGARKGRLNPILPSLAEALLSISVCSAIELIGDFPFQPFWNYSAKVGDSWDQMHGRLEQPVSQSFNASLRVTQYMSGSNIAYQQAFLIILAATFTINVFVLIYHTAILRLRLLPDLSEPLLLFILGYRSPTTESLFRDSMQHGVQNNELSRPWVVERRGYEGGFSVVGKDETEPIELEEVGDSARLGTRLRKGWRV
ncbi:hypothetical protein M011DRAFT_460974 [Sporormia fimetaria CBS 119925]|uniref:Uncharacterized protein n=1 Tax=Sporormia fimetaria CBS 119925 TaxID=1340428 RepID=A0A6A6V3L9_9PLEO|nr:hypothetical protein M011DRAFT_460974 [Sporormia fimetaria CBS 119925]